jgi:hypothetical protein
MARVELREDRFGSEASAGEYRGLEGGDILYFPVAPTLLSPEDQAFLVTRRQGGGAIHKNISYRPAEGRLRGLERTDGVADFDRARRIMAGFSERAIGFMGTLLSRYSRDWKIDYASFRPIEEEGRKVSLHSRNDLLHFDNFPTRPSHGDRLLRIFVNIHPQRPRVWTTSEPFAALAGRFADRVGVTRRPRLIDAWKRASARVGARLGLPVVDRPPYDAFMLRIHHAMKEDAAFQAGCTKERWDFPAGSAWIVFTDGTSHACLSGQHMLEQTFIVRRSSLACPELAPIAVLERLAGYPLARKGA